MSAAAAAATEPQDAENDVGGVRPRVTRERRFTLVPPVDHRAALESIAERISIDALRLAKLALDVFWADPQTVATMTPKLRRIHEAANLPESKAPVAMLYAFRFVRALAHQRYGKDSTRRF